MHSRLCALVCIHRHKHHIIGNLKSETRKTRHPSPYQYIQTVIDKTTKNHPSPPFTSHHLNLKIAFTLKTYYEDQNWSSMKTKTGRLLRPKAVVY